MTHRPFAGTVVHRNNGLSLVAKKVIFSALWCSLSQSSVDCDGNEAVRSCLEIGLYVYFSVLSGG